MTEFAIEIKTTVGEVTLTEKVPFYVECSETETNFFKTVFEKVDANEFGLARLISLQNGDKTKELKYFTHGENDDDVKYKELNACVGIANGLINIGNAIDEKSTDFYFLKLSANFKGNKTKTYQIEKVKFVTESKNVKMTIKKVTHVSKHASNKSTKTDEEKFIAYCKKLLDNNVFDKSKLKEIIDRINLTVTTKD